MRTETIKQSQQTQEKNCLPESKKIQSSDEFTFYPAVALSFIFAGKAVFASTLGKTALMSIGSVVSSLAIPPNHREVDVKDSSSRLFASQLPFYAGTALTAVFAGKAVLGKGVLTVAPMSMAAITVASVIVPASNACLDPEIKDLETFGKAVKETYAKIHATSLVVWSYVKMPFVEGFYNIGTHYPGGPKRY